MFHLRSIGVLSCAKIFAVVHAVLGILIGFLFLVLGIFGAPWLQVSRSTAWLR